jgi:hypothetical protein
MLMATNNNIFNAFMSALPSATLAKPHYIVLWKRTPFYGGPEEDGWWGNDEEPVAYHRVSTLEAAEELRKQIEAAAAAQTEEAKREHGDRCLAQLAYCEARGIDDSNSVYGEDHGAESYYVTVQKEVPEASYGDRHYS